MTVPDDDNDAVPDTAQFPAVSPPGDDARTKSGPRHAARGGHTDGVEQPDGISRAGWWAITLGAAALLLIGLLLTFGPARYWTPVPVVFLGYFLISGLIGLVFWKGVRELRDSNPTLHSGDGPASPGQRVAAAVGAVGVASALILLPLGLNTAPANAAPCPDGSQTCGPGPTQDPGPTQGNGGNTTAPQAPNTTVPGYTPPDTLAPPNGNGNTFQGTARPMPTPDQVDPNACIANCGPTQAPQQAPQTGQPTAPQTGQQQTGQNPVTTAPHTLATTPQAPTTTPKLRTPTPETTTSTTSSKARDRDDQGRDKDEDREKNSGIPYQAAWLAGVGGTYRRKASSRELWDGRAVYQTQSAQIQPGGDSGGASTGAEPGHSSMAPAPGLMPGETPSPAGPSQGSIDPSDLQTPPPTQPDDTKPKIREMNNGDDSPAVPSNPLAAIAAANAAAARAIGQKLYDTIGRPIADGARAARRWRDMLPLYVAQAAAAAAALPGLAIAAITGKDEPKVSSGPASKGERPPEVPADWERDDSRTGGGDVWRDPKSGASVRIMPPGYDPRYPDGYNVYTNKGGQPVAVTGKPPKNPGGGQISRDEARRQTHIPHQPDGSYVVPKGWPNL